MTLLRIRLHCCSAVTVLQSTRSLLGVVSASAYTASSRHYIYFIDLLVLCLSFLSQMTSNGKPIKVSAANVTLGIIFAVTCLIVKHSDDIK